MSITVTAKEHVAVLNDESSASHSSMLVPCGKCGKTTPEGLLRNTCTDGQLSVALGVGYETVAKQTP